MLLLLSTLLSIACMVHTTVESSRRGAWTTSSSAGPIGHLYEYLAV